jgi:hypothetical protein
MKLLFKEKMDDLSVKGYDDPDLDPAFVQAAKEFDQAIEAGTLTDEQIAVRDKELLELFITSHKIEDVDDEETRQLKRENFIHAVKEEVSEISDAAKLEELLSEHKDFPELVTFITARKEKLVKAETKKREDFIQGANAEIANMTDIAALDIAAEKVKDIPELVELIKQRKAELKASQPKDPKTELTDLAKKLLTQEKWTFDQLRSLGIKVTGENMTVDTIVLKREYLFNVYTRIKPAK